jgi:hypothetical protein
MLEQNLLFIALMDENVCSHMYVEPDLQMNLRARSWSLGNCSLGTYFQNSIKFGVVGDPQNSLNLERSPDWFWISSISICFNLKKRETTSPLESNLTELYSRSSLISSSKSSLNSLG